MRGWIEEGCAWIGTPLARLASAAMGRCGQVIHSVSALKSSPWRAIPALSTFSPSLRQRRVLLQYERTKRVEDVIEGTDESMPASGREPEKDRRDRRYRLEMSSFTVR